MFIMKDRVGTKWKTAREVFRENLWFFLVLLFLDGFYFLCLWLIDSRKSLKMAAAVILLTGIFFVYIFVRGLKKKRDRWVIEDLTDRIEDIERENKEVLTALRQQQEYVETWVHEIKTPISLLTLLLENREDEMSLQLYKRFQYINVQLQEQVSQILYFSRLSYDHKGEILEWVRVEECIDYVLEEYQYLLKENRITVSKNLEENHVFTDRKNLEFLLSQGVSNSIKYMYEEGERQIIFATYKEDENICLYIEDNGRGISELELPFVFEKGFTGENGQGNKKSTGIGLYLVKKLAANMGLKCWAESEKNKGFRLIIQFPVVRKEEVYDRTYFE